MARYNEIRKKIKTGDIVLFSGKGGISHGIKLVTNSKWSHVGMVLRLPDSKAVFLWESTTLSNLKDAIDGKTKKGVQLVLLSERLRSYGGEVNVRHLENYQVTRKEYMKLMGLREQARNRPYEKDRLELIKAAYDGPLGHNEEDLSSLFCSELVAEAYQRLGLLREPPNGLPSNEYTPKDFSDRKGLVLEKGASLGKEKSISF
jgi:hypothetical protein